MSMREVLVTDARLFNPAMLHCSLEGMFIRAGVDGVALLGRMGWTGSLETRVKRMGWDEMKESRQRIGEYVLEVVHMTFQLDCCSYSIHHTQRCHFTITHLPHSAGFASEACSSLASIPCSTASPSLSGAVTIGNSTSDPMWYM